MHQISMQIRVTVHWVSEIHNGIQKLQLSSFSVLSNKSTDKPKKMRYLTKITAMYKQLLEIPTVIANTCPIAVVGVPMH